LRLEEIDFAEARIHLMNKSAAGLRVRFFSVNIATGRAWMPKSMGRTFTAGIFALNTRTIEIGITET